MADNFQGSRAQRLIDEFDEGETIADGIARVLKHLMYTFDVVYDGEYDSMIGVPVKTLDELAVELRNVPDSEPEDPADEVAESVKWLRESSSRAFLDGWPNEESINLAHAADLLERLRTPQPLSGKD